MQKQLFLSIIAATILVVFGAGCGKSATNTPDFRNTQVACPMDVKLCPDGSTVVRQPPNCDFASCPASNMNTGGIQNTNAPFYSSTSTLDDLKEPHLTAAQSAALLTKLQDITQYSQGSTDQLGGLDCGAGPNHDKLVAFNAGVRKSFNANGGFLVTATPNTYHWTTRDLAAFNNDPTTSCGVATTTPIVIVGDWILWWNTCVGGAGPPVNSSPYYKSTVACLQAQEAIDKHFQISD